MNYFAVVHNSLKKNLKKQTVFIITCIVSSTLYFLYGILIYGHGGKIPSSTKQLSIILKSSISIIILMLSFFIVYSYTSYIRMREKEFKILMLIGMTKRELMGCLLLENLVLMVGCVGIGILLGTIFSKFFFILVINYVGVPNTRYSLSSVNYINTLHFFLILNIIICIRTRRLVRNTNIFNRVILKKSKSKVRETIKALMLVVFVAVTLYAKVKEKQRIHLYIWVLCMLLLYFSIFYLSKIISHFMKRRGAFYKNNFPLMKQFMRNIERDDIFIFSMAYAGFLFITFNIVWEINLLTVYSKYFSSGEYKIFRVISIFTNVVFFAISSSIIYFRCQMELERDYEYFKKLHMIGMTKEENRLLVKRKLISIFFTPCALYTFVSIIFISAIALKTGLSIFSELRILIIAFLFNLYGYNKAKKLYFEANML